MGMSKNNCMKLASVNQNIQTQTVLGRAGRVILDNGF